MKKSKLSLAIVASVASIAALASCSEVKPVNSSEGYVLTYTDSSGNVTHYSAEELFGSYYNQSSSISSMFDKVYKLIVRNYFKVEGAGISKYADIEKDAKNDVEGVKSTASKNADSNKTSYDAEWENLLNSYSCEDEAELLEHFIYEREITEFEKQFYDEKTLFGDKTGVEYLRDAKLASDKYEGYLEKKLPYHIRHILVKLSGTSSSSSFWNDTIDEKDAKNLYTVVTSLAKGDLDFGQIAKNSSEFSDSSSENYGELDIMDKDTSYVNEFKLGIYAYENLYGENTAKAEASEIGIVKDKAAYDDIKGLKGLDIASEYTKAVTYKKTVPNPGETGPLTGQYEMDGDAEGKIATIPFGAFEAMNRWARTTNTVSGEVVNEGSSAFYPRNVIFNKYLNRHNVAFITPNDIPANDPATSDAQALANENTVGVENETYAAMAGFREINGQKVLCTTSGNPILVVRAGTSDYQGIHFMVIERSPFEQKLGQATLSDYYTVKYPGQTGYINDELTYVNFLNQGTKELKARAEKVSSKIKSFDSSNLNKLIYQKYKEKQMLKFNTFEVNGVTYNLGESIDNWIKVSATKSEFDAGNSWETLWEGYINTLNQQKAERRKLVSEVCAIGFTKNNANKSDLWKEGGACYVPTQK